MKLRVQLLALAGAFAGVMTLRAQIFVWSPTPAGGGVFELATNWTGGVAPTAGAALVFGPTTGASIDVSTSINVASVTFDGTTGAGSGALSYGLHSSTSAILGLAAGGITVLNTSFGYFEFGAGLGLNLTASQTWNTGADSTVKVAGNIAGAFSLTKTGPGTLELSGLNTYTGGTIVNAGMLKLGTGGALPSGRGVTINAIGGQATLDLGSTGQSIGSLTLGGASAAPFGRNRISISSGGSLTLGGTLSLIGTNGPGGALIEGGMLNLGSANRSFDIGDSVNAGTELAIRSVVSGTGGITKSGLGTLLLDGANTFSGGVTVAAGTLLVGNSTVTGTTGILNGPVGVGTLALSSGATLAGQPGFYGAGADELEIANPVSLSTNVTLGSSAKGDGMLLTLSGAVTALSTATTVNLAPEQGVIFTGLLAGAGSGTTLTFQSGTDGAGVALLGGPTDANITKIMADRAAILVGNVNAVPNTLNLGATNGGYIGVIASDLAAVPSPAAVLSRIPITDRGSFFGTFGLDTFSDLLPPHVFTENLDLSGFGANFRLGSMSAAVVSGTITPPASLGYAFGGGGGALAVRSNLTDVSGSKSVSVSSNGTVPERSSLAIFQGNNTFSGNLSVTNAGAILDSATALPAGRSITLGAYGYLGYTEAFTGGPDFAGLVQRVSSHASTSVLGFDSHDLISNVLAYGDIESYGARLVTETLDLTNLAAVYLGSATRAVLLGPVLAPSATSRTLSLAGVGRGELEVRSLLVPGKVNGVVVGSAGFEDGTVTLSAQNTYAGGTTLNSGTLLLGDSSRVSGTTLVSGPLGTGSLTIASSGNFPTLGTSSWGETVLHNRILLGGPLQVGATGDFESYASSMSSSFGGYFDRLALAGVIQDLSATLPGSLQIEGDTVLAGANTFTGGVVLRQGELVIGHDSALGSGTFTIAPVLYDSEYGYASISTGGGPRTIGNNIVLHPPGDTYVWIGGNGSFTVNGSLTLNGSVQLAPQEFPLYLNGPVRGSAPLKSAGLGRIVVNNVTTTASDYAGGTFSDFGAIIFGTANSIPSTGLLTAGWSGYIGVADPSLQAGFLNRFNQLATSGTVGFDSLTTGTTNTFSGPVDLTVFNPDARLGSATRAILTGAITPRYNYNFGGGGGYLEVNTALTEPASAARSLWVYSSSVSPLTLRLGGGNTYSGGSTVSGSALIFKAGALPAAGSLHGSWGYIGTEDTGAPQAFIDRFDATMNNAIIGFDSFSGTPYAVSGAISLTRFGSTLDPRIFLGSATSATISGTITLPASQAVYRFAGYKGGQVTVAGPLTGTRSVEIGDPDQPATFRSPTDPSAPLSSVTLTGANDFTLGTRLSAGELGIGSNSALGAATGPLTVSAPSYYYDARPRLFASGGARTISNPITLQSSLEIGGSNALTLAGPITGTASQGLYKTGTSTLTLSPPAGNAFDGGTYIAGGNVTFAHLNAAGTGMLEFGGSLSPSATFTTDAIVHGISGDSSLSLISIAAGRVLTVNQANSATYAGQFSFGTGAALIYAGPNATSPNTLRLTGTSSYNGPTKIQGGVTVVAGANSVFGAPASPVTLDGGRLAVEPGVTIANPLTLNSGVLAGAGTFQPGGTLSIKSGLMLSPGGQHGPATLSFAGTSLSLEGGGVYRWEIADASPTGSWDQINVGGTVAINAPTMPFIFNIVPAGPLDLVGSVANFNPWLAQSWPVLNATSINVTGSLATAFAFDTSHVASQIAGGTFSFSLNTANTALLLNFTPVPEPSTYVLLGLGAVALLLSHRRRRR